MANRATHSPVLRNRAARACKLFLTLAVGASILASAQPASAENEWAGGYRKWPWKAGLTRDLGTLPGECPHCPASESSSAALALDIDMNDETLYAISPGTVDAIGSGGKAGLYIRIKDRDGSYITYEHLSSESVSTGQVVVAGQPIGVTGCSGNCSGAHLHLQRQSGPSFGSSAISLVPISGEGTHDNPWQRGVWYRSDNAGIGYSSSGYASGLIRTAYNAHGGYNLVGVSANIGDWWSPCRKDSIIGTYWRYWCNPNSTYGGSLQTFFYKGQPRALMQHDTASAAYLVLRGILGAYTEVWNGQDWVYWMGYPIANRRQWSQDGTVYRQDFENGYILHYVSCRQSVYMGGTYRATYNFCD